MQLSIKVTRCWSLPAGEIQHVVCQRASQIACKQAPAIARISSTATMEQTPPTASRPAAFLSRLLKDESNRAGKDAKSDVCPFCPRIYTVNL